MRLVTFGCSYTWGEGITSVDLRNMETPSKYSWASMLGRFLNCNVLNLAEPAASNKHILYNLYNFDFTKDDIVCVQFTYFTRDTLYSESTKFEHLNPGGKKHINKIKLYYQLYDDYNLFMNNAMIINSCYDFLQNNKLNYVCYFVGYNNNIVHTDKIKYNTQFLSDKQKSTFRDISMLVDADKRLGSDKKHYSASVHEKIAEEYYKEITSKV